MKRVRLTSGQRSQLTLILRNAQQMLLGENASIEDMLIEFRREFIVITGIDPFDDVAVTTIVNSDKAMELAIATLHSNVVRLIGMDS